MFKNPLCSALIALVVACVGLPALALVVEPPLADAAQEARAKHAFSELRCMVCDSESVADSPAEVARDVRTFVRERIAAGDSDGQIHTFLLSRYGDKILLKPPLRMSTYLLWIGPLMVIFLGLSVVFAYFAAGKVSKR